jgi:hypothetical protein
VKLLRGYSLHWNWQVLEVKVLGSESNERRSNLKLFKFDEGHHEAVIDADNFTPNVRVLDGRRNERWDLRLAWANVVARFERAERRRAAALDEPNAR